MDVDESDGAVNGSKGAGVGDGPEAGLANAEGVELLQVTFFFFFFL